MRNGNSDAVDLPEYFKIEGTDLKGFRCKRLRADLSVRACSKQWIEAGVAKGRRAEELERCKHCCLGAIHADKPHRPDNSKKLTLKELMITKEPPPRLLESPTYADSARLIAGGGEKSALEQLESVLERIGRLEIIPAILDEANAPDRATLSAELRKFSAAADVIIRLLERRSPLNVDTRPPLSTERRSPLSLKRGSPLSTVLAHGYYGQETEEQEEVLNGLIGMKISAARELERMERPGRGAAPSLNVGRISARRVCATVIMVAWNMNRGKWPTPSSVYPMAAADALWCASGGSRPTAPKRSKATKDTPDAIHTEWRRDLKYAHSLIVGSQPPWHPMKVLFERVKKGFESPPTD